MARKTSNTDKDLLWYVRRWVAAGADPERIRELLQRAAEINNSHRENADRQPPTSSSKPAG